MVTAASVLIAAFTSAAAQSPPTSGQSVRDILNRAQSQQDRKAVEDLIGKLGTSPQSPAAPAAPPAPTATPSVAVQPQTDQPAQVNAQPQPAAPQPLPPADQAVTSAPVAPSVALPAQGAAPGGPPAIAVSPPTSVSTEGPADPPSSAGIAAGPAASAPATQIPPSASVTPTSASAPASPPQDAGAPASGPSDTAVVGTPIGPAEAVPTPIAPSDAEMARAPDIARERGLPTVDLEVLFAYDSTEISPAAAESLMTLGRALQDPRLAGQKFVIIGHTDAKGASGYNLALSDRRAQAVRNFLIEHFKIAPDNLRARGFGETRLKNARNPLGPENRRVQVINWTPPVAAQRRR